MIDFQEKLNNAGKYLPQPITNRNQTIKTGDKVRCYDRNSDNLQYFVGYGTITEVYNNHEAWVISPKTEDQPELNYQYYVIAI